MILNEVAEGQFVKFKQDSVWTNSLNSAVVQLFIGEQFVVVGRPSSR